MQPSPNDNSPIDIDLGSSLIVYPFDPASKLSNTLTIVFSNTQRLLDIPWRDGASIAIVLYTTDDDDPLAITTVEAAKKIGQSDLRVEGCKRAWSPSFVQGPNSLTLILRPEQSKEPLLGHGEHSQLSVTISNLRSDLPTSVQPIPLLAMAMGFFDEPLKDTVHSFSLTRAPCPPPSGNLWSPAIAPFNQPLLATWDIQFADEMVLTFSDKESPDTVLMLSRGDFSAHEREFPLRKAALFSGEITLVASNLSNAAGFSPPSWKTGISMGACEIEASILLFPGMSVRCDWDLHPIGIVKKAMAIVTPASGGAPAGPSSMPVEFNSEVLATVEFLNAVVPEALIDVQYNFSGDPVDPSNPIMYQFGLSFPGAPPIDLSFTAASLPTGTPITRQGEGPNGPWSMSFLAGGADGAVYSLGVKFFVHVPQTSLADSEF